MSSTTRWICTVAALVGAAAMNARAQNITATLDGISPGLTENGTWNGSFFFDYPAGVMNFSGDFNFSAFCVQPLEDIDFGETLVYNIQDPTSLTDSEIVARLVGAYLSSDMSDQSAAAVQWAIWEVTTETNSVKTLFDGSVSITGPAGDTTASLADQLLADVISNPLNFPPVALTYLTHPTRQDVVTWNVVPEPTTAGLAVISGLLLFRRRRA